MLQRILGQNRWRMCLSGWISSRLWFRTIPKRWRAPSTGQGWAQTSKLPGKAFRKQFTRRPITPPRHAHHKHRGAALHRAAVPRRAAPRRQAAVPHRRVVALRHRAAAPRHRAAAPRRRAAAPRRRRAAPHRQRAVPRHRRAAPRRKAAKRLPAAQVLPKVKAPPTRNGTYKGNPVFFTGAELLPGRNISLNMIAVANEASHGKCTRICAMGNGGCRHYRANPDVPGVSGSVFEESPTCKKAEAAWLLPFLLPGKITSPRRPLW